MPRSPSPSPPFLVLDDLGKRFGDTVVLEGLSLEVAEGEVLALLGRSGSGKTTALRLLAGFETPDSGRIVVAGEEVSRREPAARGFGMVFQHYALFPHMTVGENVAFGLAAQGWKKDRARRRVDELLALVDLAGFAPRPVSTLSGGQQQRVALARALAPEPRLLLLDEPLSNLDPYLRERTRRELRAAVKAVGITTVLVTHEQEEAFDVGDRVAVLHRGRLEQVGTPEELYREPATRFVASFVGRAGALPGICEESADGAAVRLEEGVAWPGVAPAPLAAGAAAELLVRPESLELVAAGRPGSITGRVVTRRFAGALTYAVVALVLGGEVEVLVDAPGDGVATAVADGGPVGVALRRGGPRPRIFAAPEAPA